MPFAKDMTYHMLHVYTHLITNLTYIHIINKYFLIWIYEIHLYIHDVLIKCTTKGLGL